MVKIPRKRHDERKTRRSANKKKNSGAALASTQGKCRDKKSPGRNNRNIRYVRLSHLSRWLGKEKPSVRFASNCPSSVTRYVRARNLAGGEAFSSREFQQTRKLTMDWNRVEGNWKDMKGKIKEKWGKLTDDDLTVINGKREQLEGRIQQRYGYAWLATTIGRTRPLLDRYWSSLPLSACIKASEALPQTDETCRIASRL
jgi:uncharacterized protein YjbJ (UPF0337 family)